MQLNLNEFNSSILYYGINIYNPNNDIEQFEPYPDNFEPNPIQHDEHIHEPDDEYITQDHIADTTSDFVKNEYNNDSDQLSQQLDQLSQHHTTIQPPVVLSDVIFEPVDSNQIIET